MSGSSLVEKSCFKHEIIQKIINGESSRNIAKWLEKKGKEHKISHSSINNYKKNHVDIVGKAKVEVENRKKKIQNQICNAVEKEADIIEEVDSAAGNLAVAIELLKKNIRTKAKIVVNTDVELDEKETLLQREKFKYEVKKSANDDIKILHEIYKDEGEDNNVDVEARDRLIAAINNLTNDVDVDVDARADTRTNE